MRPEIDFMPCCYATIKAVHFQDGEIGIGGWMDGQNSETERKDYISINCYLGA